MHWRHAVADTVAIDIAAAVDCTSEWHNFPTGHQSRHFRAAGRFGQRYHNIYLLYERLVVCI